MKQNRIIFCLFYTFFLFISAKKNVKKQYILQNLIAPISQISNSINTPTLETQILDPFLNKNKSKDIIKSYFEDLKRCNS